MRPTNPRRALRTQGCGPANPRMRPTNPRMRPTNPRMRSYALGLVVVIQIELVRMRPQTERVDLVLTLVVDPRPDEILAEYFSTVERDGLGETAELTILSESTVLSSLCFRLSMARISAAERDVVARSAVQSRA